VQVVLLVLAGWSAASLLAAVVWVLLRAAVRSRALAARRRPTGAPVRPAPVGEVPDTRAG
jgi:hypothetical protein